MHDRILEFTESRGLPSVLAADMESLFVELANAGAISSVGSAVTGIIGERDPVSLGTDPASVAVAPDSSTRIAGRYEDLGLLGVGGMGEVRRVRDVELNRTLAMKILHQVFATEPTALARFMDEAQATAQLQHPNIVPVHDIGTLPDGRVWFTMKEIQGRTLKEAVHELHEVSAVRWETSRSGWTFRRLVNAFLSVCRAVAHAHERGVVHRDLKPENVMIGDAGEVYVVDWGLAKILGRPDLPAQDGDLDLVHTVRGSSDEHQTEVGRVVGTPAYMPPEQARGEVDRIDARSDVYALGAILYKILSGHVPYPGHDPADVLRQVIAGPPPAVGQATPSTLLGFGSLGDGPALSGPPLPDELVSACERAMGRDPDVRYQSAQELADEIEGWLDGARRREQALEVTQRALSGVTVADQLGEQAERLHTESQRLLRDIEPWQSEQDKAPAWAKAAEANHAELVASLTRLEAEQGLYGALQIAPDLPEAHEALVEVYCDRHRHAEAERNRVAASRAELRMRPHLAALPSDHPTRLECARYLEGHGALTLVTDPPGAEVLLYRYEEQNRRLVEVFERSLGRTPLVEADLPMGTYLCVLRCEGRAEVRYPVKVPRLGHWDGVRPGDAEPKPVWLPSVGALDADHIYVPPGWFECGGDPDAYAGHPARRLWCDGFVVHRFPVTNRQYVAFLDALVAEGRLEEALQYAPRERSGTVGTGGALIYGQREDGTFVLRPDGDGDQWLPEHPVSMVEWYGARAYLAWLAVREGRPWRLPGELEWEKAARGVDGRWYPWGDHGDPSWSRVRAGLRGREHGDWGWSEVDAYPVDVSPFGMRGAAGNVLDFCLDAEGRAVNDIVVSPDVGELSPGVSRVCRGASWSSSGTLTRLGRVSTLPSVRNPNLGFRGLFRIEPV